jgi:maltodextrin utilization protein YvdJ
MKNLMCVFSIVVLASCSSNKYAAHFTHYDRNESYAVNRVREQTGSLPKIEPEMLTASIETKPVIAQPAIQQAKQKFASMTKQERSQLKAEIKKEIRQLTKKKSENVAKVINTSGSWDQDLKLAAIFGVVGLVALIIGTSLFNVIGAISLIIGAVFLVKWIMRQ